MQTLENIADGVIGRIRISNGISGDLVAAIPCSVIEWVNHQPRDLGADAEIWEIVFNKVQGDRDNEPNSKEWFERAFRTTCKECGSEYKCTYIQSRFCSNTCGDVAYKKVRNNSRPSRAKPSVLKICDHCKEGFTAKRLDAKYCSPKCRMVVSRSR